MVRRKNERSMAPFRSLKVVAGLEELAKGPIDLSKEGVLSPERVNAFKSEALQMRLLYATERVTEEVMQALFSLAREASVIEKMKKMQEGEIVNFIEGVECENRPALHTAVRDFFSEKTSSLVAREASRLAYEEVEKLKKLTEEIGQKRNIEHIVQIGIGGSQLGPEAVYLALFGSVKNGKKVHFLSNVDPDDAAAIFNSVDLRKTLVVSVSKSGTTLETRTNEEFARSYFKKAGIDPKEHLIAVTGRGSPMDDPSRYLASFYIWDYIGGRYSVTSMVGGVMLALALGMDCFLDFLRGASAMDKIALLDDPKKNLPLMAALLGIWNRNFLKLPTEAVIPYSQALLRFAAHLQQLDMESNGKQIDKSGRAVDFDTGPIVWGEIGTNGQHSFYQLLHQGTTIVPLELIGFSQSQRGEDLSYEETTSQEKLLANLFAQSIALSVGQRNSNPNKNFFGNRPNRLLLMKRLDAHSMGSLLSYFEHKVAFQGFIWNINSFDQEGVQLGKKLALNILDLFIQKKKKGHFDPQTFPLAQHYLNQIP